MPATPARFVPPIVALCITGAMMTGAAPGRASTPARPAPSPGAADGPPLRPRTFAVDARRSTGRIENLQALYVQPEAFAAWLSARHPGATLGSLPLCNAYRAVAELSVEGVAIGTIAPLTLGALHGVPTGTYAVRWLLPNGYAETRTVQAVAAEPSLGVADRTAQGPQPAVHPGCTQAAPTAPPVRPAQRSMPSDPAPFPRRKQQPRPAQRMGRDDDDAAGGDRGDAWVR